MGKTIGVVFGGRSTEHDVSIESAKTVVKNLSKAGYTVAPIYITREGRWRLVPGAVLLNGSKLSGTEIVPSFDKRAFLRGSKGSLRMDAAFPLVHGSTGEDGVLQGFLELMDVPYVGSGVLASAAGMDKVLAKKMALGCGLPVLPHEEFVSRAAADIRKGLAGARRLGLPLFVKPVSLGSSVGVTKVKSAADLGSAVRRAFKYDQRVMAEKGVDMARELVCGVLGAPDGAKASVVGEVKPKGRHEFFDYEAKYLDDNGMDFVVPACISKAVSDRLRRMSVDVFRAMGCYGMARVDFLMSRSSEHKFYFCEINTIPGFTSHSLYPTLWKNTGLEPVKLAKALVELAFKRQREKNRIVTVR